MGAAPLPSGLSLSQIRETLTLTLKFRREARGITAIYIKVEVSKRMGQISRDQLAVHTRAPLSLRERPISTTPSCTFTAAPWVKVSVTSKRLASVSVVRLIVQVDPVNPHHNKTCRQAAHLHGGIGT